MATTRKGHSAAATKPAWEGRPPIKKILVPIDFSEASWMALRHAVPLALALKAKITVLYVFQGRAYSSEFAHLPEDEMSIETRSKEELEKCTAESIPREVAGEILVRNGAAFDEIVKVARSQDIDLIVINRRGHSRLKQMLLGSTAERVVRFAPCPVLVVAEK